jgi:hypothetical protein
MKIIIMQIEDSIQFQLPFRLTNLFAFLVFTILQAATSSVINTIT